MAYFYSELMSWTTGGLLIGAVALSAVEGSLTPDTSASFLASKAEGPIDLPKSSTPGVDKLAISSALPRIESIPQAKLQTVTFATSSDPESLASVQRKPVGTVTGNSVNLRSGPGTGFAVVGRAALDDELAVTGASEGIWVEVEMPLSRDPAWIHGKFFIPPDVSVLAQN